MIKRLLVWALIDRKPDPEDRRRVVLTLTAEGRALVAAMPSGHAISDRALAGLSEAERRSFLALLRRLA